MQGIDRLLEMDAFGIDPAKKRQEVMEAMRESLVFHYDHCEGFRKVCDKRGFDPKGNYRLEDVPFLPVDIFKTVDLVSVGEKGLAQVNSSSTTSGMPSKIYLDSVTTKRQRLALNRIMANQSSNRNI